jgi:two-component system, NarL family, sensor kinase
VPWGEIRVPGGIGVRVLTARRVAGCAAGVPVALAAAVVALAYMDRNLVPGCLVAWDFSAVFGQVVNLAVPVVGFVLASRRPGNWIGWLFLAGGLAVGLRGFWYQYALRALVAAPGSWPAGRVFGWLFNWVWVVPLAMLALVFLIFPTGHVRSPRWRPLGWLVVSALALATAGALVVATRTWGQPFASPSRQLGAPLALAPPFVLLAALVASVAAVVVRFARPAGEERLQLKWSAAAAVLVIITLIVSFPVSSAVTDALLNLTLLCLFAAIGIAVLKYRLYDIDIVISQAVLYGSLAVFITAVYAALVVGIGTLAGNTRSPLLAALAAAVVAVAFQPVRQWAGRLASGSPNTPTPPGPASACRRRTQPCAPPCPATEPATTPATPPWGRASGTWPTGSPPSAAGSRSGPPPATAPPSPGTPPSPLARQPGPAHEVCHVRAEVTD